MEPMRRELGHYSEKYFRHHAFGGWHVRIRTWLERRALAKAIELAGHPSSMLDIPCGAGRFWPTLVACCPGPILAMDLDPTMIRVAMREGDAATTPRISATVSSIFDIQAEDDAVDTAVSLRFFHHLAQRQDRLHALSELRRVARDTLIVSLWTDRNVSSWLKRDRLRRNQLVSKPGYGPRVTLPSSTFQSEVRSIGLDVIGSVDVLPFLGKDRLYVLGVGKSAKHGGATSDSPKDEPRT
jgi:SAM-dependent methyltransferase